MNAQVLAGVLLGGTVAAALVLTVGAWTGRLPRRPTAGTRRRRRLSAADRRRLGASVAAAVATTVLTRWPVAAVAVAVLVWVWPKLFGGQRAAQAQIRRIEALAVWTESLRDVTAGAVGLQQAIPATVPGAAPSLQQPLRRLVGMTQAQVPLPEALASFADELDDPTADLVVGALVLNAQYRGPQLRLTLTRLAASARQELSMRRTIEADRATNRRSVQIVVAVTLITAIGLGAFQRTYVAPYATVTGQFVLGVFISLFMASFWWLRRLTETTSPPRFLAGPDQLSAVTGRSYR